jgi:hypothetical protein
LAEDADSQIEPFQNSGKKPRASHKMEELEEFQMIERSINKDISNSSPNSKKLIKL